MAKFKINESCRRKLRFKDIARISRREVKGGRLEYVYGGLDTRAIADGHYQRGEKDFPPRSSAPCVRCYRWERLQVENPSALILHAFIPSCATRSHARVHFFHLSYFFITCPREYVVGTRKYCRPPSNRTPPPCSIPGIGREISVLGLSSFRRCRDHRSRAKKLEFSYVDLSDDSLTGSKFFRASNGGGC